jgi:hypothetical protein
MLLAMEDCLRDGLRLSRLADHDRERRHLVVPLDNHRDLPESIECGRVERPHHGRDRSTVIVEQVGAVIGVTRQVELFDPVAGKRPYVGVSVEPVVVGVDNNVIEIEQQIAIGALRDRGHELDLGHLIGLILNVARNVLEHEAGSE